MRAIGRGVLVQVRDAGPLGDLVDGFRQVRIGSDGGAVAFAARAVAGLAFALPLGAVLAFALPLGAVLAFALPLGAVLAFALRLVALRLVGLLRAHALFHRDQPLGENAHGVGRSALAELA